MEREEQHFVEDPTLRRPFIEQESLDEFTIRVFPWSFSPHIGEICARQGIRPEALSATVEKRWMETIDRETTLNEYLYLKGFTSRTERMVIIDQLHIAIRDDLVEQGFIPPIGPDESDALDWMEE